MDGFTNPLSFLADGIFPVTDGVVHVQQAAERIRFPVLTVLPDGAEGILLGNSVLIRAIAGLGVAQMLPKEQIQFFCQSGNILPLYTGIHIAGCKQCRFPAHQRRQAAQSIHQPAGKDIRAGLG